MKRMLLLLVLMLSGTLSAREISPVLYWATDAGSVGFYDPLTQTQTTYDLGFKINTNQLRWLPDTGVFVYQPDQATFQTIDAGSGKVLCSLASSPSLRGWDVLSVSENTLAIYEATAAGDQTRIVSFHWRTCAVEALGSIDGLLRLSSLSPDLPLLALATRQISNSDFLSISILNLETHRLKTLDIAPLDTNALYWTQDSKYLVTGSIAPIDLYDPASDAIHTIDSLDGDLWLGFDAPVVYSTFMEGDFSVQAWGFEEGQLGKLLLYIPDESYNHLPRSFAQGRYYAYQRTSVPLNTMVFDLQTGETHHLEGVSGLWHWSGDEQWLGIVNWYNETITLYNPQTREQRTYNGSPSWYGGYGLWSPVGQTLIYWQTEGENDSLMLVDISEGTPQSVYTQNTTDYPGSVSWSPDGAYVYVNTTGMRADGQMQGCHLVVDVAAQHTDTLGCDQTGRSVHWG